MANPKPQVVQRDDLLNTGILGEEHLRRARALLIEVNSPWYSVNDLLSFSSPTFGRITDPVTILRLTEALSRVAARGLVIFSLPARFEPLGMSPVGQSLLTRTDPRLAVPSRLATMLAAGGRGLLADSPAGLTLAPTLDRVMAAPEIDVAVYGYLARLDPARFLPGVGEIPENSITVLETNPRFIEALLVGLNDEMNRELLWRAFPTDQRGTLFRRFWDRSGGATDVCPIHTWAVTNGLGANGPSGPGGQIALLIRGQLLRRYPNTSIYAWRSRNGVLIDPPTTSDDIKRPVFTGVLGVDITFVGFDLTDVDLRQGDGWFFVLQEQPTEPRFGFDEFDGPGAPLSWSNATWQHTATAPGRYLRITGNPLAGVKIGDVRFVDHAAHLAAITIQKPMRVAAHAGGLPQLAAS